MTEGCWYACDCGCGGEGKRDREKGLVLFGRVDCACSSTGACWKVWFGAEEKAEPAVSDPPGLWLRYFIVSTNPDVCGFENGLVLCRPMCKLTVAAAAPKDASESAVPAGPVGIIDCRNGLTDCVGWLAT